MVCDRYNCYFLFWAIFALSPPPPPPPPKNRKKIGFLKKWEKQLETSSFYALYQKPQSYEVWFLIQSETDIIFCQIGLFFSLLPPPSLPPNNPENQNFEKMKKACEDVIIILHMCTKNQDHMRYLSFWAIFYPFTPLMTPKITTWKNVKKTLRDIILFHMFTMKILWWDIRHEQRDEVNFFKINEMGGLKILLEKGGKPKWQGGIGWGCLEMGGWHVILRFLWIFLMM